MTEARDPHHDGVNEWRWAGDPRAPHLEHRTEGSSQWVAVKRVSVTPARIRLLASLLNGSGSPPVGPLQALRERLQGIEWQAGSNTATALPEIKRCVAETLTLVESVEEQLAALQRAARMYRDEAHLVVPASQHHPEYIKALESLDALLARGSSPSSPKGDA